MSEATEYIWLLKLRVSNLTKQLDAYRNGNKVKSIRAEYESVIYKKNSEIRELRSELARSHAREVTIRKYWSQIMDDTYEDTRKLVEEEKKKTLQMEDRALRAERQRDEALDERTAWRHKYYEQAERMEELEGQVQKLTAQVNKDFRNSSVPSSQQGPGRKKIPNSRTKTGRKRGGQIGHEGHRLTQQKPTRSIHIPDPEKYTNDPDLPILTKKQNCLRLSMFRLSIIFRNMWRWHQRQLKNSRSILPALLEMMCFNVRPCHG